MPDKSDVPVVRDCIVKLLDDHGVEHSVRFRAKSVYEAALRGLARLDKFGWESNGSEIGIVAVEVYEEPTRHTVDVKKLLEWLHGGRLPPLRKEGASKGGAASVGLGQRAEPAPAFVSRLLNRRDHTLSCADQRRRLGWR